MKKLFLLLLVFALSVHLVTLAQECTQCSNFSSPLGTNASRIGTNTNATGHSAFASGYNSQASGNYSTALGYAATAGGIYSLSMGLNTTASASTAFAIGQNVQATQPGTFVIGKYVTASASNALVFGVGYSSTALLTNSIPNSIMFGAYSSTPSITIRQVAASNAIALVGVGTTDPKQLLHINGNTLLSGTNNSLLFGPTTISSTNLNGNFGIRYINNSGLHFYKPAVGSSIAVNNILYIRDSGNIGIGTNNPETKLHVSGDTKTTNLTATENVQAGSLTTVGTIQGRTLTITGATQTNTLTTTGNAQVGSLTTNGVVQASSLNILGASIMNTLIAGGSIQAASFSTNGTIQSLSSRTGSLIVSDNVTFSRLGGSNKVLVINSNGDVGTENYTSFQDNLGDHKALQNINLNGKLIVNGASSTAGLFVATNGNIGIGTTSPAQKLAVNGNIRAKEIKVETANWPDYVFDNTHELMPLEQVEDYIKQNGRLPEIPSAQEVAENGVNLGEINALLLKKIEELTLYLIQQQTTINELKTKIDTMEGGK